MAPTEWTTGPESIVEAERVRTFAAAVGHPRESVPPTFAVTLTWEVQNRILDGTLPKTGLGLHGEHAMRFVRHLEVGETVTPRARLESVMPRRTGTTVTCRTEVLASELPVVTQLFTVFQVGHFLPADGQLFPLSDEPPEPASGARVTDVAQLVEQDQALRYAAASGDTYEIHTDPGVARAVGLRDVILHGMCTLAMAANSVVVAAADGDDRRLRYLSARFTAPVHPGEVLTTRVRSSGGNGWFSATTNSERMVLERGRFTLSTA